MNLRVFLGSLQSSKHTLRSDDESTHSNTYITTSSLSVGGIVSVVMLLPLLFPQINAIISKILLLLLLSLLSQLIVLGQW